jgi:fatty acid desaturase
MNFTGKYHLHCTLTYGDIYGQVIVWLLVIFASLAAALSLMSSPLYAALTVGLILVISLPFLLFAFVTTLLNHIELEPMEAGQTAKGGSQTTRAQAVG